MFSMLRDESSICTVDCAWSCRDVSFSGPGGIMLEYLLGHMVPLSNVRRNLIVVIGIGILIAFFTVDTSDFHFLGVRFDPDTLTFIISFLCIFYSLSMAFKSLLIFRVYSKDRSRMVNDIKALLIQEYKEYSGRDINMSPKLMRFDEIASKNAKVLSAMHSLDALRADSSWGYAAIVFEYVFPIVLGLFLGAFLAFRLF